MDVEKFREEYAAFLAGKHIVANPCGFAVDRSEINPMLSGDFAFQSDIVIWGLRRGRAAFFEDCGLGKTFQQLEWSRIVSQRTDAPTLIFAPLMVAEQTVDEGRKLGIRVSLCESQSDVESGVNITNYEKLHKFSPDRWGGVVLDESSILKSLDGKTRKAITEFSRNIPLRLACTATPAPNDYAELGTHAEFLGIMSQAEMLATFFVHDGGETSKWRLKRHAEESFWKWLCSWSVAIRKPSDLGYPDHGFDLPKLHVRHFTVASDNIPEGFLFPVEASTLQERLAERRDTIVERADACAELAIKSDEQWVIWCNLNSESESIHALIKDSVEVTGSDKPHEKIEKIGSFLNGQSRVLVTKGTIAGYGINMQQCRNVIVLLDDSWEKFYQIVRRCWRFGQKRDVNCWIVTSENQAAVMRNIERKENQAREMMDGMVRHMRAEMQREVLGASRETSEYRRETKRSDSGSWTIELGDTVEAMFGVDSESVDFSIYSPPFASLYTYSNSDRDMGNSRNYEEFSAHLRFVNRQLHRVMKPGRLVSVHCMNLPLTKEKDGVIGIRDFRGDLIRWMVETGFVFHSEVCIWKDPVTAMQRTKAIGLLYKQLRKDSCISRQGIPDYLVTFRKIGANADPVTKTHEGFPVSKWQEYASPVWMDINPSDTLQRESAREEDDERHICPLQLSVIERAIELWTNPGDLVLSPFAGIGSEGVVAVRNGRRFWGSELKPSYFEQAWRNLQNAEKSSKQAGLFEEAEDDADAS